MEYKYPFISDKRMYSAVMCACKMIRDTGYFNKAVSYYSNKYNVDEDELKKHIRDRQFAGRNAKNASGYKMKNFIVKTYAACDANPEPNLISVERVKGKSIENVKDRFNAKNEKRTMRNDTGSSYSLYYWSNVEEQPNDKG